MSSIKSRLLNILFWSVVSAAFIGPGTVTTATRAGSDYGFDLMWALVFSTFACLLLQEASARITIYSKLNLGQAIAKQFEGKKSRNLVLFLVVGAIIFGSAAYETGNILGSVAGLSLISDFSRRFLVLGIVLLAFLALSLHSIRAIAKFMGAIVILMGIAFLTTAIYLKPSFTEILRGSVVPTIPYFDSGLLIILGLIGTTVVPYDLFLGSGVLDKKQAIGEMRFGLSVAVILGGIISMAVLTVGTIITPEFLNDAFNAGELESTEFSYSALALALTKNIGGWAVYIFGFGMFAAGFSSAITAPLASAITARSLFGAKNPKKWETQALYFRLVSTGVLAVGFIFGMMDVKPIPVIILAQALNGLILPFVSVFLIFVINDTQVMGIDKANSWFSNVLMIIVVWITMIIGFINILRAIESTLEFSLAKGPLLFSIIGSITFFISMWILFLIWQKRRNQLSGL